MRPSSARTASTSSNGGWSNRAWRGARPTETLQRRRASKFGEARFSGPTRSIRSARPKDDVMANDATPIAAGSRVSTGIGDLDNILGGGLTKDRAYLLEGTP